MQSKQGQDRRRHPRRDASLVVSFRPDYPGAVYDITHTGNISEGGMLLTAASPFAPGTPLLLQARLTLRGTRRLVQGTAKVLGYRELVPNLLYETRVRFVELDTKSSRIIADLCAGEAELLAATG